MGFYKHHYKLDPVSSTVNCALRGDESVKKISIAMVISWWYFWALPNSHGICQRFYTAGFSG